MASDRDQLIDMGFPELKVDRALKATKNAGLIPAIEWLDAHADDPDVVDEPTTAPQALGIASGPETNDDNDEGEITAEQVTAQSLKCDDCGKLFRDSSKAEFHAMKSGHVNFSESSEVIKPLTPEEKAAKLVELKARLAAKREEKRLRELAEEKEREKVRRKSGREIAELKEKMKNQEIQRALDASKREKEAERVAKAKIKAQIEQDKQDRIAKREAEKLAAQGIAPPQPVITPSGPSSPVSANKEYTEARLQIRKPNGEALTKIFKANDTLEDVYEFVGAELTTPFKLMMTFPRKVLDGPDRLKTLKELNLAPSAALVAQLS